MKVFDGQFQGVQQIGPGFLQRTALALHARHFFEPAYVTAIRGGFKDSRQFHVWQFATKPWSWQLDSRNRAQVAHHYPGPLEKATGRGNDHDQVGMGLTEMKDMQDYYRANDIAA